MLRWQMVFSESNLASMGVAAGDEWDWNIIRCAIFQMDLRNDYNLGGMEFASRR
jgi:hypothetical protein